MSDAEKRRWRVECYECKHKQDVAGNTHIWCKKPDVLVEGDAHGIANGWFDYPFLFDPTWRINACRNYEAK